VSFENFNLHPGIMAGIRSAGYTEPTPIQRDGIPPVMAGRDLIGLAQTGTGKTAAFVLPILNKLIGKPRHLTTLILAPTRELAEQINEAIIQLGYRSGISSAAIYGGMGMETQRNHLKRGTQVIVACPGRLLDHIWQGNVDFTHLEMLVIDEADRMFDMGFLPDVRKILKCLPERRQTLLFSATMPDDVKLLVKEVLRDPVTVKIGQTAPADTVAHALYPVCQDRKTALLKTLLQDIKGSVLVFTRTKYRCERVADQLAQSGCKVASLQGNLSQNRRQAALDGFREGKCQVLVATDIAARGIDVSRVSHVINYDMPDTTDAYIHRIGRTGRIGNSGDAFTLVTAEDELMIHMLEKLLKSPIERRTLTNFDYGRPQIPAPQAIQPLRRDARQSNRRSVGGQIHPTSYRQAQRSKPSSGIRKAAYSLSPR
jgi:ATP-dependent RNA helicase RhlE